MEKMQALFTMHKILVALDKPEIKTNIYVDVDPKISKSSEDLVIKIKYNLDNQTCKILQPIVEKRNLKIEKIEDAFIIH
ncbi:MAG: hypothetical protein ABSD92_06180 [Candidatus Bathyarchaeia archaeon]